MLKLPFAFMFIFLLAAGCTTLPEDAVAPVIPNSFTYYNTNDGLLDSEVLSVFEDAVGNIWIGTYYGVSKFDGNSFQNFTPQNDGLVTGGIVAIGEDYNGAIWIGSSDGFSTFEDNEWYTQTGISFTSFYRDKDNYFWIGTEGFGALQLSEAGIESYSDPNCALCSYVTSFTEDSDGMLWFSTLGGVTKVTNKNNQATQRYTTAHGLASDFIARLIHDQWGNLWFGTYDADAISKYSGNDFTNVYLPTGYTEISGFAENKNGIYITTRELGFLHYDGTVITEIKTPFEDYYLNCIVKDSKGNFWIGTYDNGLIKFTPKSRAL